MKKIVVLLLFFAALVNALSSCKNQGGNGKETALNTTDPIVSTSDLNTQGYENVISWATYGYDKVRGDKKAPENASNSTEIYLARNEAEGAQFFLRSETDIEGVTFSCTSGANDTVSYQTYTVKYVTLNEKQYYSDPLLDYEDGDKVDVKGGEPLGFYVEFKTDNTPAGQYKYSFEAKDSNGKLIASYEVTLNVWNFSYPETPSLATAVGVWSSKISRWYGFCGETVYKQFYDYMLEHKMSPYDLPYDILDDRADAYMSDPRVTSFCVRWSGGVDIEKIDKIYEKLKTNPVWMEKAYIYLLDEPRNEEHFQRIEKEFPTYKERWPELKICTPFYLNLQVNENEDQLDFLSKYVDLLCPKLNMLGTEDQFPNYYERLMEIRENGGKVWTYVCNKPKFPYANLHIDMSGLTNRAVFWQTYQYDMDGFLYYCAVNWTWDNSYNNDVWKDAGGQDQWWGDGILLYPGVSPIYGYTFRRTAPFGSIRLKIFRDGVEDYDLLKMAEETLGKEYVDQKLNEVSSSLIKIDVDDDGFASIRIAIGNALSEAMSDK